MNIINFFFFFSSDEHTAESLWGLTQTSKIRPQICRQSRLNPTISSEGPSRQSPGMSNCWTQRGTSSLASKCRIFFISSITATKTQTADVFCQHEGPSDSSFVWRRTPHQYGLQLSIIAWRILRLLYLVELAFTLRFELYAAHFFFLWRRGAVHVWVEQSINCSGPGRQRWGETAGLQSCFCSCGPCPPLSPSSSSACWLRSINKAL